MTLVTLPHMFTPRHYQLPVLRALDNGAKRAVAVWHRRSGKEKTFLNYAAKKTAERIGSYYYFFPTYAQAKKAIWDGMDRDGFRFINHFPREYVKAVDRNEMKLTLATGSIFQLVGTDNFDAIMSTNPLGCVFAEYSLQDPRAWDYIRPILRENGGWAIFDYTPRGKNHGYTLYEMARKLMAEGDPTWFAQRLSVEDTGVLTPADIAAERREGMTEDMIQQEYFCSFSGVQQGSIFGKQIDAAETSKRVCGVPWLPEFPVSTWWNIGSGDAIAIWFTQDVGREVHLIDYYENASVGAGLDHYVRHLQSLPYVWDKHNGPHDMEQHSYDAHGKSALEVAASLGIKFQIGPNVDEHDGIISARAFMSRCWFDENKTERGRLALSSYHYSWDEKRKKFTIEPYDDWSSNGSKALVNLAIGHKFAAPRRKVFEETYQGQSSSGELAWLGA